ncbi:hypothetical protein SEA_AEGEUS_48 [Mycobacterium phage Aegeus]|nr:hypothetical protein SEA_BAUDELAIRE_48 [Mycobacterium phage Baudelaire]WKW86540.1 hypothetical protein SEA_AEGEUS_48 [Mycobacterium phage Aegeus]
MSGLPCLCPGGRAIRRQVEVAMNIVCFHNGSIKPNGMGGTCMGS